ncbi:hypothetical protein SAMN04487972_1235 [Paracoccus halophilus]|uniref:Uncharacterized protein n=1 Tax=Paracoccus halophilus TaxID=376733 RepID=A0A099EYT0_9RHOB|nr:hypothetical protein [Paracoccus halophilus]KGJ03141.1 hypothetical protein IT41_15025 [Paracoccus halophilus]SFA59046.1 hypothetical protein SAMN04487972_1235 [Paracoccus halophilus]
MKIPVHSAGALVLMTGIALAGGGMTVQLPDVSDLPETEARAMLADLARVNVITANCPDYPISEGEWTLITGTGDRLAARLGLDAASYDKSYYAPAFELLADPGTCDRIGPMAQPMIRRLIGMGGDTERLSQPQ